jgi:hypothetical protein
VVADLPVCPTKPAPLNVRRIDQTRRSGTTATENAISELSHRLPDGLIRLVTARVYSYLMTARFVGRKFEMFGRYAAVAMLSEIPTRKGYYNKAQGSPRMRGVR